MYFMTMDQARFRRPVLPGDQLRIKVVKQRKKLGVWRFLGRGEGRRTNWRPRRSSAP